MAIAVQHMAAVRGCDSHIMKIPRCNITLDQSPKLGVVGGREREARHANTL